MKQSSTHPHFMFRSSCMNVSNVINVHSHINTTANLSKTQADIPWWEPAYCTMMLCVGAFPPWLTSDYCDVCWESCIWFHWLVLQGFTGLTGLFPSKCEGIVSLCCTWASCWLCAQTGKLLKMGITGFVFTQSPYTTRWLEIWAALITFAAFKFVGPHAEGVEGFVETLHL